MLERKQECRTLSGWLLASTQSPCNGASGIRQPRTTGSSRSCMTQWPKSPSSTPSEIRLELSGADEPKVLAAPKRVTRPRPRQLHVAAVRPNAGHWQLQQGPMKSCSDSLLGSFALRARGSEVMPQYGALVGPGPSWCARLCGCWRPGHVQVRARVGYSESLAQPE